MIDLNHLEKYKENNRIEAKQALGGLPDSIWETYSAFANTFGGIILLGVEEHSDRSLHAIGLPDPVYLLEEFWKDINDINKVSLNILTERDVRQEAVDGKAIIVIHVPRAERTDKPIYIGGDPISGTYRRNGDGDHHCTFEETQAMMRDAASRSQDMLVLENMDMNVFDHESIHIYRERMHISRPGQVWEQLEDDDFLYKLGAVSRGKDGRRYPTAAGLLMFGYEYEIIKEFPYYSLEYREQTDDISDITYQIISSSGDWSGNVFDFYIKVYDRIFHDINISNDENTDNRSVLNALCEALANSITNADFYGRNGLIIIKKRDIITFSNPGNFRIEVEAAKSGGVSDPRNLTLKRMFDMIILRENTGNGLQNIYRIWDKQGWEVPTITEKYDPERITLSLSISDKDIPGKDKIYDIKDKKNITDLQRQTIIEYLTDHVSVRTNILAELLGVENKRIYSLISKLIKDGIVISEGDNRDRTYRLKEK